MNANPIQYVTRGYNNELTLEKSVDIENIKDDMANAAEVSYRSTDCARTNISAQCLAYGLHFGHLLSTTPEEHELVDPLSRHFKWNASPRNNISLPCEMPRVPVAILSRAEDRLISFASCPRYGSFWNIFFRSAGFLVLLERYKTSLDFLCTQYALNCTKLGSEYVFWLADYAIAAEFEGRLPVLSQHPEHLTALEELLTQIRLEMITADEWMQRVAMHNFSHVVPTQFQAAIERPGTSPKLSFFSTHDTVLLAFILGLGVNKEAKILQTIPFASYLIIELRKRKLPANGQSLYYVNATYNGSPILLHDYEQFLLPYTQLYIFHITRYSSGNP